MVETLCERRPQTEQAHEDSSQFWQYVSRESSELIGTYLPPLQRQFNQVLGSVSRLAKQIAESPSNEDWTVAVDLTTDYGKGRGVPDRMKQFNEFATRTKDTNIQVVVQAAVPIMDEKGKPTDKHNLERYLIEQGKITKIETVPSAGYGKDLEGLLKFASDKAPSKRMGLIVDSHGMGNLGLKGDTGEIEVDDFVTAVKSGLNGTGREKLDLVDFDCCLMAQDGVARRLSSVTEHMVASSEKESTEGQPFLPSIELLGQKPTTDGSAFAASLVEEARRQSNQRIKDNKDVPIDTLSHFKLTEYQPFEKSLNVFGDKLCNSLGDPASRRAVEKAIEDSRNFGERGGGFLAFMFGGHGPVRDRRDLKEFTENIIKAVDQKQIKDPDGSLRKAAVDLQEKRTKLVESFYVHGNYNTTGGVTSFIPDAAQRNLRQQVRLATGAGRIVESTRPEEFERVNKSQASRDAFAKQVKEDTASLRGVQRNVLAALIGNTEPSRDQPVKEVATQLAALDRAVSRFQNAESQKERRRAFFQVRERAIELERTDYVQTVQERMLHKKRQDSTDAFKLQLADKDSGGWANFRKRLGENVSR